MVFNATFNNISVISWRSLLLVEETGVPGEHHRPVFNITTTAIAKLSIGHKQSTLIYNRVNVFGS
jgi:hypothetical protein